MTRRRVDAVQAFNIQLGGILNDIGDHDPVVLQALAGLFLNIEPGSRLHTELKSDYVVGAFEEALATIRRAYPPPKSRKAA